MKDIDFLPEQYKEANRRHDLRVSRVWLAMIGLSALGVWFGVGAIQIHESQARLVELNQQNSMAQKASDIMDQLSGEQTRLLERYKLAQKLKPNFSYVRILTKLAELIPQQVAVERLDISNEKIQNKSKVGGELIRVVDKISGERSDAEGTQPEITQLRVIINGLAPSEMDVALLIGQLSSDQAFRNVRLEYCKSGTVENHRACTFRVALVTREVSSYDEDDLSLEVHD